MNTVRIEKLRGTDAIEFRIHEGEKVRLYREATIFEQQREIALAEAFALVQRNLDGLVFTWRPVGID